MWNYGKISSVKLKNGGINLRYKNVVEGIFKERKNRFVAVVEIQGKSEVCHVKNTGRLKELFVPGVTVGLCGSDNPERKTKYDVISVLKDGEWVNVDSQAPNIAAGEWISKGGLGNATLVKAEQSYVTSDKSEKARFDFYVELDGGKKKAFVEVKGVTLKEDGVALFPDAPTERGIRHLNVLCDAVKQGYEAYAVFVIQMKGVHTFSPNVKTHPEFGKALAEAKKCGVKIFAVDCVSGIDFMNINREVIVNCDCI